MPRNWLHHIIPKYLAGFATPDVAKLPAAYHQLITNAFREAWPYGAGQPNPQTLINIVRKVYSSYPLPPR
jgi:hypothetical protein